MIPVKLVKEWIKNIPDDFMLDIPFGDYKAHGTEEIIVFRNEGEFPKVLYALDIKTNKTVRG